MSGNVGRHDRGPARPVERVGLRRLPWPDGSAPGPAHRRSRRGRGTVGRSAAADLSSPSNRWRRAALATPGTAVRSVPAGTGRTTEPRGWPGGRSRRHADPRRGRVSRCAGWTTEPASSWWTRWSRAARRPAVRRTPPSPSPGDPRGSVLRPARQRRMATRRRPWRRSPGGCSATPLAAAVRLECTGTGGCVADRAIGRRGTAAHPGVSAPVAARRPRSSAEALAYHLARRAAGSDAWSREATRGAVDRRPAAPSHPARARVSEAPVRDAASPAAAGKAPSCLTCRHADERSTRRWHGDPAADRSAGDRAARPQADPRITRVGS